MRSSRCSARRRNRWSIQETRCRTRIPASDSCRNTQRRMRSIAVSQGATTLEVGTDKWPFPFPLVQRDGRWRFDSTAGVEEIVNRRVGDNELATIQSCLAFVDAQREYYVRNAQQDPLLHFAQKLVSTEGQKDGLYWPTTGDEAAESARRGFAQARSEGYFEEGVSDGDAVPRLRLSAAEGAGTPCRRRRLRLHGRRQDARRLCAASPSPPSTAARV